MGVTPADDQKRLSILWLSHTLPWPAKGGLRQRSYNLMRELSKWHDVDVVSFHQKSQQPTEKELAGARTAIQEFANLLAVHSLPQDRLRGGQFQLAALSLLPGDPYTARWGKSTEYRTSVRQALSHKKYDIIHFDTISLAQYADLAGSTPCALNHHNIESAMLLRRAQIERNPARKLYFWQEGTRLTRYEHVIAPHFSRHLVCSELDGNRLVETAGAIKTHVVPNGVDLDYFRPSLRARDHRPSSLIFVGGLTWYPNASAVRFFLNDIWPLLVKDHPDVVFDIVGRSPPRDFIELADQDPRVRVHGFVDEMRPMLDSAAVYICPIFDGGGTKLKMIDALAMRKAIVAHPIACEGLALSDGSNVILAERPEQFVAHIRKLFESVELRDSIGDSARRHVEDRFSFESIGKDLADLYSSMALETA